MNHTNGTTDRAVDVVVLNELRRYQVPGKPDLLQELISLFNGGTEASLSKMQIALGSSDYKSISAEAHKMKSASGNLGAYQLAAICEKLETAAGGAQGSAPVPKLVAPLLSELIQEFGRVKGELETESKKGLLSEAA